MDDNLDLDEFDDDSGDENLDEAQLVRKLRGVIRESKKRERALQKQADDNSAATKKLAFIEADLPDEPQVKFFLDHYQGDYTAEAIRSAAAENGFLVPDQETQEDVGQVQRMMQASGGSGKINSPGSDGELLERINAVPPGPNASKHIRDIMARAGRYDSDE